MSTRGCVAVGTATEWRGPYNHYDSYPEGLGAEVWRVLQDARQGEGIAAFAANLLTLDDWRQIKTKGICEYCGQKTGQPHSITLPHRSSPGPYPDPEALRHQHNTGGPDEHHIKHNDTGSWIEWVYVIDVAANALHVIGGEKGLLITLPLDGREPVWSEISKYEPIHMALVFPSQPGDPPPPPPRNALDRVASALGDD